MHPFHTIVVAVDFSDTSADTIETALELCDRDEWVEVTPDAVRIRKRVLDYNKRPRRDDD